MNALTTTPMPMGEMQVLARAIAASGLFGIKTPDAALVLMCIAQAEGRHPVEAARDYDIINGKPAKKAEAMMRDFIQAGGTVKWHSLTDELADATFTHPQTGEVRIDWDMKRAMTAFGKKDMYGKFPRQMLRSRVVSEGVRTLWPLATSGMYIPEEQADIPPEHNGTTLEHEPPPKPTAATSGPKARHSVAPPPGAPDADWQKCLDWLAPAMERLRSRQQVIEVAGGPTCGDIIANAPDWAKAELDKILDNNYRRFPEESKGGDDLSDVEIVGADKVSAG